MQNDLIVKKCFDPEIKVFMNTVLSQYKDWHRTYMDALEDSVHRHFFDEGCMCFGEYLAEADLTSHACLYEMLVQHGIGIRPANYEFYSFLRDDEETNL